MSLFTGYAAIDERRAVSRTSDLARELRVSDARSVRARVVAQDALRSPEQPITAHEPSALPPTKSWRPSWIPAWEVGAATASVCATNAADCGRAAARCGVQGVKSSPSSFTSAPYEPQRTSLRIQGRRSVLRSYNLTSDTYSH